MFAWGSIANGVLGISGKESDLVLNPVPLEYLADQSVVQVACSRSHTLFLTAEGKVFTCGGSTSANEDTPEPPPKQEQPQQDEHSLPSKRPHKPILKRVAELDDYTITQIACGNGFSLALTEWGQVFTWGRNEHGELSNGSYQDAPVPRQIKFFSQKVIVQICAGQSHAMALTSCGELYAWGSNIYGQLGMATAAEMPRTNVPRLVRGLSGMPIALLACGANHSLVVSKSGAVYGWGRNNCGQLGLNTDQDRHLPKQLATMRSLRVRYVACGDEFTMFLTKEGGVFTCGAGGHGQLGHGQLSNELLPRKVMELMGSQVTQIACGSRHAVALVPLHGRIYSFGEGRHGQLGNRSTDGAATPVMVPGHWVAANAPVEESANAVVIRQIFCGADRTVITTSNLSEKLEAVDYREYPARTQILELTKELAVSCSQLPPHEAIPSETLDVVEPLFRSLACLNGSLLQGDEPCSSKNYGLDMDLATEVFELLAKIENESLKDLIYEKITTELMAALPSNPADAEVLRIFMLLPVYNEFINSKHYERLHTPFSQALKRLEQVPLRMLQSWCRMAPAAWFERFVSIFRDVIIYLVVFKVKRRSMPRTLLRAEATLPESTFQHVPYDRNLMEALGVLNLLHCIHKERAERIGTECFVWTDLLDYVDIEQEYVRWLFENNHTLMHIFGYAAPAPQFLLLNVSRENLVQDTLREIVSHNPVDLKKPLKIQFCGEEGIDAGGIRKEFFMLLLRDLLDPKYGMFKESEETRTLWFCDHSFETDDMYFLIGVICGLALYNFTIINLPFPLALYKKILGERVDLGDLCSLSPTVGHSMQALLSYEGDDIEEVFDVNFEVSREVFGTYQTVPLMPGGSETRVNKENREEFVRLYVDYVFNKCVEKQFQAFHGGFAKVCSGPVLKIFKADELMAAIIGNQQYDWEKLEEYCVYKEGYTAGDPTIQLFWEVFHELPEKEKRNFLLFLTGSDRVPIQGMKAIKISIQPTGDERFLPVAHTCFNLLDLPRYRTKERLRYKLLAAIKHTEGFTIV